MEGPRGGGLLVHRTAPPWPHPGGPRAEVDRWTEIEPELLTTWMEVAQAIGQGVRAAWDAPRAGMVIAGFEVPHMHIHVAPTWDLSDFDFTKTEVEEDRKVLEAAAEKLRSALHELGFPHAVPPRT